MVILRKSFSTESLEEEFSKERAEALASAGNRVSDALEKMQAIDRVIEKYLQISAGVQDKLYDHYKDHNTGGWKEIILRKINEEVIRYNKLREHALLCYYYLLVTREALGLRNHKWVENIYAIPEKKRPL